MALSIQGHIYLACYSVWEQEADDAPMQRWVVDQMNTVLWYHVTALIVTVLLLSAFQP